METQCTMSCSCCCAQWSFMDEVNCVASRVSSLGEPSIYLGEIYVLIKYLIKRITECTCLIFVRR